MLKGSTVQSECNYGMRPQKASHTRNGGPYHLIRQSTWTLRDTCVHVCRTHRKSIRKGANFRFSCSSGNDMTVPVCIYIYTYIHKHTYTHDGCHQYLPWLMRAQSGAISSLMTKGFGTCAARFSFDMRGECSSKSRTPCDQIVELW